MILLLSKVKPNYPLEVAISDSLLVNRMWQKWEGGTSESRSEGTLWLPPPPLFLGWLACGTLAFTSCGLTGSLVKGSMGWGSKAFYQQPVRNQSLQPIAMKGNHLRSGLSALFKPAAPLKSLMKLQLLWTPWLQPHETLSCSYIPDSLRLLKKEIVVVLSCYVFGVLC